MALALFLIAVCARTVAGVMLSSYENGAKFDKCINTTDWESKTLADDIDLADRGSDGCCPTGTVPGVKHYPKYVGAQVVCGFTSDGSVTFKTTSGSKQSCTYNQCYVWKQNLECSGGGKQRLNGCCAAKADCGSGKCGFKENCENYAYSMSNVYSQKSEYCLTYNKVYKMENTNDKTDDQADGKLKTDKLYVYTPCAGMGAGSSTGGTSTGGGSSTGGGNSTGSGTSTGGGNSTGDGSTTMAAPKATADGAVHSTWRAVTCLVGLAFAFQ